MEMVEEKEPKSNESRKKSLEVEEKELRGVEEEKEVKERREIKKNFGLWLLKETVWKNSCFFFFAFLDPNGISLHSIPF